VKSIDGGGGYRRRARYVLHLVLLFLTLVTTSAMGARLAENFAGNRAISVDDMLLSLRSIAHPASLVAGLPYSATLLLILLAHEMGHYVTCRYYGIDASLPYFLPSPLLIGTFGAFIRIRSPIFSKRALFDVGIAGPIAGFVLAVPALAIGLAYSKIIPGIALQGDLTFSAPLVQRLLQLVILPGVPLNDVLLHPVARAAWVGMFATALNLLPIGQLDGGHILYAFIGDVHRLVSRLLALALVPLAFATQYWSWIGWALLLLLFLRHPRIYDETGLDRARIKLGVLAAAMLVLCFMAAPVRT
jgi:membrane-associated protease RseP (regulator of RpoE activity)